jgi:DNA-binding PadR family transcriptional regulator
MNRTYPTTLVLQSLARGYHYGFDVMEATSLASGTVYPILRKLEREALATSSWEDAGVAHRAQRPPRRYYRITALGERVLQASRERFREVEIAVTPRAEPLEEQP